ncbi:IS66 family insertion sequence element accessory protein TnpB [Ferrovum myxofaciens]|uniref:IS66 family insertion sequence element accessory protein TnpB n=1 Tax=Ferrovum myxofaciens TaxID=416213 RepID=UPI00235732F8|nr:IS66 family insertion sequence element accessory protein TnpB [Ferrovum myxofaciens]MBU6993435.1 IS66 family insertion sequence element accessory protein TnpB [Ferrovum myxofaciens]
MPANPYDGLYALARNEMKQDPLSGHLFCFINRRANQIKVLWWDRSGFVFGVNAWSREDSSPDWSQIRSCETDWTHLRKTSAGGRGTESPSGKRFPVCQPLETRAKITRKYTNRKSITTRLIRGTYYVMSKALETAQNPPTKSRF